MVYLTGKKNGDPMKQSHQAFALLIFFVLEADLEKKAITLNFSLIGSSILLFFVTQSFSLCTMNKST